VMIAPVFLRAYVKIGSSSDTGSTSAAPLPAPPSHLSSVPPLVWGGNYPAKAVWALHRVSPLSFVTSSRASTLSPLYYRIRAAVSVTVLTTPVSVALLRCSPSVALDHPWASPSPIRVAKATTSTPGTRNG
jgi:hypothetical protein